jgi:hypothetical protein
VPSSLLKMNSFGCYMFITYEFHGARNSHPGLGEKFKFNLINTIGNNYHSHLHINIVINLTQIWKVFIKPVPICTRIYVCRDTVFK